MLDAITLEIFLVAFNIVVYFIITFILKLFKKELMFHLEYVLTIIVSSLLIFEVILTANTWFIYLYFLSPFCVFFAGSIRAGFMILKK